MTLRKDMRTAIPSGHSVPLLIVPQTVALSVNFGTLIVPAGMRTITMKRIKRFIVVPTELNRAIYNVGIDEMPPWIIIMRDVSRKI
jgi:hypothetical protein